MNWRIHSIRVNGLRCLEDVTLDLTEGTSGRPRDFALMGDYVLTADQDSDCICVLRLDRKRGRLEDTGIRAGTARPSCICPA